MKVTIYTVPDCQFSRAEKEYLTAHQLSFEEKNLETNKEFLTEMLTLSNNFAGTPVTKIEKDDGTTAILKGYTKEEFDKALSIPTEKETVVNSTIDVPPDKKPQEATPTPPTATPPTPPAPQAPPTQAEPTPPSPAEASAKAGPTPTPPPATPDPMKSVLDNLQAKSDSSAPTSQAPATTPNVPDFKDK